jgi:hypothetical protein
LVLVFAIIVMVGILTASTLLGHTSESVDQVKIVIDYNGSWNGGLSTTYHQGNAGSKTSFTGIGSYNFSIM